MNSRRPLQSPLCLLLVGVASILVMALTLGACNPRIVILEPTPTPARPAPERILFIGTTRTKLTYSVETDLRELAASAEPPLTLDMRTVYHGAWRLSNHWNAPASKALDAIREDGWDVVVLQERTSTVVNDPEEFREYATKFDEEIRKVGAQTVLFMTWGIESVPNATPENMAKVYEDVGAALGATVAPVGLAWARSAEEEPGLVLTMTIGSGTTYAGYAGVHGTYLNACVFFATLFEQSPVGLSYSPEGLAESERVFLQRIAWETVQERQ